MSDRNHLFEMSNGVPDYKTKRHGCLDMFMDGGSGTWRLFIDQDSDDRRYHCVDLSLEQLRQLSQNLLLVLADVDTHPDDYNAEIRRSWKR